MFYPKNTTSKLQAMDQGVIANLKAKFKKIMMNSSRSQVHSVKDVTEMAKGITIFDAICNTNLALHAVDPSTIVKCFNRSGVYDFKTEDTPQKLPDHTENLDDDPEFASYFQDLLNMPWEEYLAQDNEDELEQPARAPDAQSYTYEKDEVAPPPDTNVRAPISHDECLDKLIDIRNYCLGYEQLLPLVNRLMNDIQAMKVRDQLSSKCKQSTLMSYFTRG